MSDNHLTVSVDIEIKYCSQTIEFLWHNVRLMHKLYGPQEVLTKHDLKKPFVDAFSLLLIG